MQPCVDCRFCGISKGYYTYLGIDEPIYSNQDFFIIASIGALVEGWSLIVPKEHQFSMKNCYNSDLFNKAFDTVLQKLRIEYGNNIIAFEHGANSNKSVTACGTSHAHLHLVPYPISLTSQLMAKNLNWISCRPSEIASYVNNSEYLYYSDISNDKNWLDTVGVLHKLEKPTSQFFRRIIALQCGMKSYANYKQHPFLDIALKTRNILSS